MSRISCMCLRCEVAKCLYPIRIGGNWRRGINGGRAINITLACQGSITRCRLDKMEMRESGIEESQRIMTKTRLETGLLCKNPIKVTVYCTKSFPWLLYGNGSQARTRFKTAVNCLTDNCGKCNQTWSSWYGEGYVISLIISQGISISCNENPAIQYKVSDIKDVWFHQIAFGLM